MEHLERFAPLGLLAAIAAFVLILIRRGWREQAIPGAAEAAAMRRPALEPATLAVAITPMAETSMQPIPEQESRPVSTAPQPVQTPIHDVLALLQRKDTLAAGFLLGEILGRPVSRRR